MILVYIYCVFIKYQNINSGYLEVKMEEKHYFLLIFFCIKKFQIINMRQTQ